MMALGYACSLNDLFVRFPYEKCKSLIKNFKSKVSRKAKVKKVFREGLKLIVEDIIENNATFLFYGNTYYKGEIHMEVFNGSEFNRLKQLGKFKDVDFIESLFTGYLMYLYIRGRRDKLFSSTKLPIYLNTAYSKRITELTNQGKKYC